MIQPTWAEVIRQAIDARLLDVHTSIPARVVAFDSIAQTVDALPMVRRAVPSDDGETVHEDLPIVPNVPILYPRSGIASITWPLAPGDFVMLMSCHSAIAQWRTKGELADPGDLRRHGLGSCVAVPGIAPDGQGLPSAVDGVMLEAPVIYVGENAVAFVALATLVLARLQELYTAMANAVIVVGDGGASLKSTYIAYLTTQAWPPPPSVASTKLKAE